MSDKVLLTAFQPFGAKGALSGNNISKQVCDVLAKEQGGRVNYVVLDVGETGESQLADALAMNPRGVLLSGEDTSMIGPQVRIEPKAYDPAQQLNLTIPKLVPWGVLSLRLPGASSLSSDFAEEAVAAAGGRKVAFQTGIGTFWCNRIYYRALQWGDPRSRPVLFVHLGVFGQLNEKLATMRAILELMLANVGLR